MLRFPRQYKLWAIVFALLVLTAGCGGAQTNTALSGQVRIAV